MGSSVSVWTVEDVVKIVADLGSRLEPYGELIRQHGIDGKKLSQIKDETAFKDLLDQLNITNRLHRRVLTKQFDLHHSKQRNLYHKYHATHPSANQNWDKRWLRRASLQSGAPNTSTASTTANRRFSWNSNQSSDEFSPSDRSRRRPSMFGRRKSSISGSSLEEAAKAALALLDIDDDSSDIQSIKSNDSGFAPSTSPVRSLRRPSISNPLRRPSLSNLIQSPAARRNSFNAAAVNAPATRKSNVTTDVVINATLTPTTTTRWNSRRRRASTAMLGGEIMMSAAAAVVLEEDEESSDALELSAGAASASGGGSSSSRPRPRRWKSWRRLSGGSLPGSGRSNRRSSMNQMLQGGPSRRSSLLGRQRHRSLSISSGDSMSCADSIDSARSGTKTANKQTTITSHQPFASPKRRQSLPSMTSILSVHDSNLLLPPTIDSSCSLTETPTSLLESKLFTGADGQLKKIACTRPPFNPLVSPTSTSSTFLSSEAGDDEDRDELMRELENQAKLQRKQRHALLERQRSLRGQLELARNASSQRNLQQGC